MISHTPHLRAKLAVVIMGGASGSSDELEKLKTLAKFLKMSPRKKRDVWIFDDNIIATSESASFLRKRINHQDR